MRHFARQGLDVETVLFSSYERMNACLLGKTIHVAWNGPLAHARIVRLAGADKVLALGMRDSDRDFSTLGIVREDSGINAIEDLANRRLALGTVDSPQAYLAPLAHLLASAVPLHSLTVLRYDRDVGKHGDTAHGETGVLDALRGGAAEAGFISALMWQRFEKDGLTAGLAVRRSLCPPPFDHCQFTALRGSLSLPRARAFQQALLAMDGTGHAEDAHTMALEGLRKAWLPSRGGPLATSSDAPLPDATAGYRGLLQLLATSNEPKVKWPGHLHTPKNHPFKHLIVDSSLVRDSFGC
jgi:phosphonate transport system substrate-binding protein